MRNKVRQSRLAALLKYLQGFDTRPYSALFVLVSIISLPTLKNSFLSIDDVMLIVNNHKMTVTIGNIIDIFCRPLGQLHDKSFYSDFSFAYYRPFLDILYMFNYTLWGINPVGFHITNLLLHLGTVFFVYRIGLILLNADRTVALIAAALFAVHPVHNELIGRVAMNENILGLLIAASFYCFLTGKRTLSLVAFAAALLSKESAALFPVVIFVFANNGSDSTGSVRKNLPFLWLLSAYVVIRLAVIGIPEVAGVPQPVQATFLFCSAFADYMKLFIFPFQLSYYYPPWNFTSILQPGLLPALLIFVVVTIWVKKRGVQNRECKLFLGAFIMLLPALMKANELILNSSRAYIADRQLYTASIFLVLLIGSFLIRFSGGTTRKYLLLSAVAVVALLSYQTISLCAVWENDDVLLSRYCHDYPAMSISHQYRGRVFLNSHDYDHALSEFEAALQVEKNIWKSLGSHSKPLSPTGNSFTKVELINKYSLAQYRSEYAELHFLLGIVYLAQHDSQRAITKFKVSLQMQPHFLDARIALAELYLQLGRIAEARKEFAAALMDIRQSSVYIP